MAIFVFRRFQCSSDVNADTDLVSKLSHSSFPPTLMHFRKYITPTVSADTVVVSQLRQSNSADTGLHSNVSQAARYSSYEE
jgi:hypothetical protein